MKPPTPTQPKYIPGTPVKPGLTRPLTSEERRRAQRSLRSSAAGYEDYSRKRHYTEEDRGSRCPSAAVQPGRFVGGDRIFNAFPQFLERFFPARHQLNRTSFFLRTESA